MFIAFFFLSFNSTADKVVAFLADSGRQITLHILLPLLRLVFNRCRCFNLYLSILPQVGDIGLHQYAIQPHKPKIKALISLGTQLVNL